MLAYFFAMNIIIEWITYEDLHVSLRPEVDKQLTLAGYAHLIQK